MSVSLNATHSIAKKAARGAGYSWGLAEEAANAVRWLCQHDIDGCSALARWLMQFDGTPISAWELQIGTDTWTASSGTLCPLITGSAISDNAGTLKESNIRLHQVAEPCLLSFFAAMAARQLDTTVTLQWPGTVITTNGSRVTCRGVVESSPQSVVVESGGAMDEHNALRSRAEPPVDAWTSLNRFADRTYAPATEESRVKGAGAGITDND